MADSVSTDKPADEVFDIDALVLHGPLEDAGGEAAEEIDCQPTSAIDLTGYQESNSNSN
jgi:hypothetical protein